MFLNSLRKTIFPATCYSGSSGFAGSGQGMRCMALSKVAVVTACTSGAFSSEHGGRGAAFCPATVTTTVLPAFRSSLTLASVLVMNAIIKAFNPDAGSCAPCQHSWLLPGYADQSPCCKKIKIQFYITGGIIISSILFDKEHAFLIPSAAW